MILLSFLIGAAVGLIYLVLFTFLPTVMPKVVFVVAALLLITFGILILAVPIKLFSPHVWNVLLAILLIILGIAFIVYLVCYKDELKLATIFLKHANQFLKEDPKVYLYIPLFLLLTFGLFVLIVWQYIAYGTTYEPTYEEGDLWKRSNSNGLLQFLNVV